MQAGSDNPRSQMDDASALSIGFHIVKAAAHQIPFQQKRSGPIDAISKGEMRSRIAGIMQHALQNSFHSKFAEPQWYTTNTRSVPVATAKQVHHECLLFRAMPAAMLSRECVGNVWKGQKRHW